jgi:hypothetical protein
MAACAACGFRRYLGTGKSLSFVRAHTMPTNRSMAWRNRIFGGIAIAFGLALVVLLGIDGRWDNHDTTKPLKALVGGLVFIGVGAWFLLRGAEAKSWRNNKIPLSSEGRNRTQHLDADSILADLENNPEFKAECRKVESAARKRAAEMERAFESELKGKP